MICSIRRYLISVVVLVGVAVVILVVVSVVVVLVFVVIVVVAFVVVIVIVVGLRHLTLKFGQNRAS